ncbi:MAG: helicase-related protein, partial [Nanopusillaceae archaeon]
SGKELKITEIPYEIIYKFIEKNKKYQYDIFIVDESQNVFSQSRGSKRTKVITKIVLSLTKYAKNILFMSATPTVNGNHETYNYLRALGFNISDIKNYFYYNKKSKRKNKIIIENFFNTYESLYQYCFDLYNKVLYVNLKSFEEKAKMFNVRKEIVEAKINDKELLYIFRDHLVIPLARELEKLRKRKFSNKKEEDEEKIKAIMPILSRYISVISYYIDGFYYKEEFGDIQYINPEHPKMKNLVKLIRKHSNTKISIAIRNKNFKLFKSILENESKRKVYFLTGDDKELESYKKDDKGILVFTIKTGGEGINLSDTDVLIFYQYWWTFASLKQATDRILRIDSPNKDKYIYFLITVPEFDKEDLERVIPDDLYYFALALYEKGYISLDLWMRKRILEKQKLWEKEFVKDEKSIMEEIADEIAKLYYESKQQ